MDKQKANTFKNFFATIGRKTLERLNLTEPAFTPTATHGFTFDPTTPSEIEKLIDKMKVNSAVGYDNIPAKIILDLKPVLCEPLSHLISVSFAQSMFPSNMKHAIVRPIYKIKVLTTTLNIICSFQYSRL